MRIGILRTLCLILFCVCFGIPTISLSYGEPATCGRPPLAQKFGSKPGAYDLIIRISQPIVDPGDRLRVEVYISGYGVIEAAKVAFYPSPEVFDPSKSKVKGSLKRCKDGLWGWGKDSTELDAIGHVLSLGEGGSRCRSCHDRPDAAVALVTVAEISADFSVGYSAG